VIWSFWRLVAGLIPLFRKAFSCASKALETLAKKRLEIAVARVIRVIDLFPYAIEYDGVGMLGAGPHFIDFREAEASRIATASSSEHPKS
jgi:hypothetical protein